MITTIILVVITLILLEGVWDHHLHREYGGGVSSAIGDSLGTLAIMFLVWGLAMSLCSGIGTMRTVHTTQTPIRALSNSSGTEGSFFLGSGYVKDKLTYAYIAQEQDGGFTLRSLDAHRARVYEDSPAGTGFIRYTYVGPTSNRWSFFTQVPSQEPIAQVHVPFGSVQAPSFTVGVGK